MVSLSPVRSIHSVFDGMDIEVYTQASGALGVTSAFNQFALTNAFGCYWGIGIGNEYPPVIFVIDEDKEIDVLGYKKEP